MGLASPSILILGMHRSGTSLLAEIVREWGAYGNEAALLPGDIWNERGYFEFAPLVRLNDDLLATVQSRWNLPPDDHARPALDALAQHPEFRARALRLMEAMQKAGRPWFWKDPRLCILLPFWKHFLPDAVYVVPVRDPASIAASLTRRDGLSTRAGLALWQRYMSEILRDEGVRSSAIFVSYDALLKHPERECQKLRDRLDSYLGSGPNDGAERDDDRAQQMASAVANDLCHNRSGSSFCSSPVATPSQRELFRELSGLATSAAPPPHPAIACDSGWRQILFEDHMDQRMGFRRSRWQVLWRAPGDCYSEENSASALLIADGSPQRSAIATPPSAIAGIRIDLGDFPATIFLMGLKVVSADQEPVWEWNGDAESLTRLPHQEIAACTSLSGEKACRLQIDGFDPWVEIVLDSRQTELMRNGGTVELECGYQHAPHLYAPVLNRQAGRLQSRIAAVEAAVQHLTPVRAESPGEQNGTSSSKLRRTLAELRRALGAIWQS